jgi:hypothetical protein
MDASSSDAVEPQPPPEDDLEAIAAAAARRRKRMLVAGGGILAVLVAGGYGLSVQQERAADQRIGRAFGSLSRCLLGTPLEKGETAGVRLRRIQLTGMALADKERAPDAAGQGWPERCSTYAFQVDEGLRDAGRTKGDNDLSHAAAALGKLLKEPTSFFADLGAQVDAVWSFAELEKVTAAPAVDVAAPPGSSEPLDADALGRGTPLAQKAFSFKTIFTEPHPALDLRVLVDDPSTPGGSFLCTMKRAAPEARCAPLPAAVAATKQGVRIFGTADDGAAPLLFAGNRGSEGIFRADTGERVDQLYAYGGYAAADGFSAVLGWKEKEKELVASRKAPGAPVTQTKLDPPFRTGNPYYSAQMLWGEVMLRGVTKDNQRRLFALAQNRTGPVLGEPVDVGELAEPGLIEGGLDEPPHINGCKTGEAMVVRVKGYDNDFLTFRLGGKWASPVSPEMTGGTLSCSKSAAAITRVEPAGAGSTYQTSVRQVRCTSAGCRTDVIRMQQLLHDRLEFAPRDNHVDAVDLDGKMLVVWAAGERGGVRMRLAPAEAIAKAADTILYDDLMKDGRVTNLSTFFDLKLFSREGFAVLLLSTVTGVHALRIDPDGKVTPMKVSRG